MSRELLRVGFVPGVMPDRWARSWRERRARVRLELVALEEAAAETSVRSGEVDMALLRLPVTGSDLHQVRLYEEQPVVVVARDHPVAAYDEIALSDMVTEQFVGGPPEGLQPEVAQLAFAPMGPREAIAVAASGAAVVVLPMSLARLHHRRDAVHRPVSGLAPTTVALVWPVAADDAVTQAFVGVVRGRTPRSSRG